MLPYGATEGRECGAEERRRKAERKGRKVARKISMKRQSLPRNSGCKPIRIGVGCRESHVNTSFNPKVPKTGGMNYTFAHVGKSWKGGK